MYVFLLSPNGPLSKRSLRSCEDHVCPYMVTVREEASGGVAVFMTTQSLQCRISSACLYNNRKVPSVNWLPLDSAGIVQHQLIRISITGAYTLTLHAGISARLGEIGR